MTTIHTATVTDDEMGIMCFASVGGAFFIGVNRLPVDARDVKAVEAIVEGDGNFKPLLMGKAWLEEHGATFDTKEVS